MKHIKRKEAVVKVAELIGKNMEPAKKYQDIISLEQINKILIAHN